MNKTLILSLLIFLVSQCDVLESNDSGYSCFTESGYVPSTFSMSKLKEFKVVSNSSTNQIYLDLYNDLLIQADELLTKPLLTVTNKRGPQPSADKNDYVSLAPYWWPNEDTPDGLPYVPLDGIRNPEVYNYNRKDLSNLKKYISILSFAYYVTNKEEYANHAILLLEHWFLKEESKMNPHLWHAQYIPGKVDGRFYGIIDSRDFIYVLDATTLLRESNNWNCSLETGLKEWFSKYSKWLMTSSFGNQEQKQSNNHGSWFDYQLSSFLLFIDYEKHAKNLFTESAKTRSEQQITEEGVQSHEVIRTLGLHYSVFNLEALSGISEISARYGYNYWETNTDAPSKLETATLYILPYLIDQTDWPHVQIVDYDECKSMKLLQQAYTHTNNPEIIETIEILESRGCSSYSFISELINEGN